MGLSKETASRNRHREYVRAWRARRAYDKRWKGWSFTDICRAAGWFCSPRSSLDPLYWPAWAKNIAEENWPELTAERALVLYREGMSCRQIANRLGVSVKTVNNTVYPR